MKKLKNKKSRNTGITLIALVVTIIILIILATISINIIVGENGLIAQAEKSKGVYENSADREKDAMEKYANMIGSASGGGTTDPDLDRSKIKIGDYIDYKPQSKEESPIYTNLDEQYTGSAKNETSISRDTNMKWQVLKVNSDGSMDIIGTPTSQKVYFKGATGYNNGVNILNNICETLYSREDDGIKARSVNGEDFENAEIKDENGKTASEKYISDAVGKLTKEAYITNVNTDNNTITFAHNKSYYPNLYAKENGSGTTDDETIKKDGISKSDKADSLDTSIGEDARQQAENLTITYTYYVLQIDKDNYGDVAEVIKSISDYWIASRYVYGYSASASFSLRSYEDD